MAEQLPNKDEVYEAIRDPTSVNYLTETECRDVLSYLSGYSPDGMSEALALIRRQRRRYLERDRA